MKGLLLLEKERRVLQQQNENCCPAGVGDGNECLHFSS